MFPEILFLFLIETQQLEHVVHRCMDGVFSDASPGALLAMTAVVDKSLLTLLFSNVKMKSKMARKASPFLDLDCVVSILRYLVVRMELGVCGSQR